MFNLLHTLNLQVVFLSFLITVVAPDCSPLKEGDTRELTCNVSSASSRCDFGNKLRWLLQRNDMLVTASTCSTFSVCTDTLPSTVTASIRQNTGNIYMSTLTVLADRTSGIDYSSPFICGPCSGSRSDVCDSIQIYALPENPSCNVVRVPDNDEFTSLKITCQTQKVYPQARCDFYYTKDDNSQKFTGGPVYTHPTTSGNPQYFSSTCSNELVISGLEEGTYTFSGQIYPGVTGRGNLPGVVNTLVPDPGITLTLPTTTYTCDTEIKDEHFKGKTVTCTCNLTPGGQGNPKGRATWYQGATPTGLQNPNQDGSSLLTVTSSDPAPTYTCDGTSNLGRKVGQTLTPKFAYLEDSIQVTATKTIVNLCDGFTQPTVTCGIMRSKANPMPTFEFSSNGVDFTTTPPDVSSRSYYQAIYSPTITSGGNFLVTCRLTNTFFTDLAVTKRIPIEYREPPTFYPIITVAGDSKTYSGPEPQTITVKAGSSADFKCQIRGGSPSGATNTQMKCDKSLFDKTGRNTEVTASVPSLTSDADEASCSCKADHNSGCYNKETTFTLNVLYKPEVTIQINPQKTFNEGDQTTIRCTSQANPPPSLVLTQQRTSDRLNTRQPDQKLTRIDRQITLSCLNTGAYICKSDNSQGSTEKTDQIFVKCPQKFLNPSSVSVKIDAYVGEFKIIPLEIYGYPAPTTISFVDIKGTNLMMDDPRFNADYVPLDPPVGTLNITIGSVTEADFTNYIVTVDNGVGIRDALVYRFFLNEVVRTVEAEEEESQESGESDKGFNVWTLMLGLGIGIVLAAGAVIVLLMLHRKGLLPCIQRQPKQDNNADENSEHEDNNADENSEHEVHSDGTANAGGGEIQYHQYHTIADPGYDQLNIAFSPPPRYEEVQLADRLTARETTRVQVSTHRDSPYVNGSTREDGTYVNEGQI